MNVFFVLKKLKYRCNIGVFVALFLDNIEDKITKYLQKHRRVKAFGDSMNDYFMLKRADKVFLISKPDGTLSSSLKNRNLEGIRIV